MARADRTSADVERSDGAGTAQARLFAGPGELRALCRAHDWAATALGHPAAWPQSLRTAVDLCLASPFPMCLWWGPELVLVYNDRYLEVLGVARHPWALGRPAPEVWAEVWDQVAHEFAQVMAGGTVSHADQRYMIRRDGREVEAFFTYALSPVRDEAGAAAGVLNVVTETTDRVRLVGALGAERERLRSLIRDMPAPVALHTGPEHRFEIVSDSFRRIAGGRDLLGMTPREAYPELEGQGILERFDEVLATGEPWLALERHARIDRRGAGIEDTWFDVRYEPVRDAAGRVVGVLNFSFDVTEQVRARREVERLLRESEEARGEADAARAAAETAARLKTEFLATMSHEFRTPLNAILGYAQLLHMGVLGAISPVQHAHLERLEASGRHLLRLVDDVLDVAKVDADRLAVRAEVLATGAAVAAALALVQPQATAKGIRVYDLGALGPGVPYVGDEHRARQILVNVLSNAVKFTPPGGEITVACGAAAEPEPGVQPGGPGAAGQAGDVDPAAWAFVRVEDTGPGIPPGLASRLFEPFVQADGALTREQGGTGLGLAISRRLARLMGGDLVARNRTGGGAAFTLWLPAAAAPGDVGPAIPDATRPARRTPAGMPVIPAPAGAPGAGAPAGDGGLDAAAYAVLHALSIRLAAQAETVAERYVAALRADGRFPGARELPGVQLRDHATPSVGLLASQLMVIGETRGAAPELLGDGAEVERVMAELHGAQRHRLGWSEADLEREAPLLLAEVEQAIRGALDTATAGGPAVDTAAVRAAAQYAADVARASINQGTRTALRAYRFAKAAATP